MRYTLQQRLHQCHEVGAENQVNNHINHHYRNGNNNSRLAKWFTFGVAVGNDNNSQNQTDERRKHGKNDSSNRQTAVTFILHYACGHSAIGQITALSSICLPQFLQYITNAPFIYGKLYYILVQFTMQNYKICQQKGKIAYTAKKMFMPRQRGQCHFCKQNFHSSLQNVNLISVNKISVAKQIACIEVWNSKTCENSPPKQKTQPKSYITLRCEFVY